MDDDSRELAHRLFAAATAMLEDAIEVAVAGQSPQLPPLELSKHGRHLQAVVREILVLAEAAVIVADPGCNPGRNPQDHNR